ncbi:type VII secretion protein EssB [Metabacillus sp. 84]|uniref:type VII secretion protein EssB n=1 Tax=unclassified Metabacillus TaxID=2675274 RepID=UPI003CF074CD
MAEKELDYLEHQLECKVEKDGTQRTFIFQQEKIKLDSALEVAMLESLGGDIDRSIQMTDDEMIITARPAPSYQNFQDLLEKDRHSKWVFAHQLVEKVKAHSYARLHLIVSPDNLAISKGLAPDFLHYGVRESLPPYEKDDDRVWQEVRAVIAAAVDSKFSFEQYIKFHETLQVSPLVKEIFETKTPEDLSALISRKIEKLEDDERSLVHIPNKKWKTFRYVSLGFLVLLIPALIYTVYSVFFLQPQAEAYIKSGEYFQNREFSSVIDTLDRYEAEDMPDIVKYQLATSIISTTKAKLTEEQRESLLGQISPETNAQFFDYWIHIGRGNNEQALEIARTLRDQFSIVYALINYEAEVRASDELKGEEKQAKLDDLQQEIEDYKKEQDAIKKAEEDAKEEEEQKKQAQEEEKAREEAEAKAKEEAEAKAAAEKEKQEAQEKEKKPAS